MSAAVSYAMDLMEQGHPLTSAARAAGCCVTDIPSIILKRTDYAPPPPRPVPVILPRVMAPADRTTEIMRRVGAPFGVTPQMMRDIRQTRTVAWPRAAAMAAIREELPHLSLPAIGQKFGGRDHTTALHAIRQHKARMAWVELLIWAAKPDEQPDLFARAA